jgi:hypothetical protein
MTDAGPETRLVFARARREWTMRNLDEMTVVERYLFQLQGYRDGVATPGMKNPYPGDSGEAVCWELGFTAGGINREFIELGIRAFRSGLSRGWNPYPESTDGATGSHEFWNHGWRYAWAQAKAAKGKR